MRHRLRLACLLLVLGPAAARLPAQEAPLKKVLIVVEGPTTLKNKAMGDARQIAALLGHFHTSYTLVGDQDYGPHALERYDITFYIGFSVSHSVPRRFLDDVLVTRKPVVWLNTGFREACRYPAFRSRWGFVVDRFDSTSSFQSVRHAASLFAKGEPNLNRIEIVHRNKVSVVATAIAAKARLEVPYIVHADNLIYFADSPFASAGEGDRYLLFADMLHDILGEQHEETGRSAIIRIEDVNPMDNPGRLREIADLLSARDIPFLVGVSPFYVNPGEGTRVSLTDKPELVDALRYMVQNGGTIVMHGVTHQYKGVTGADYEFWDESTNGPIPDETVEGIARKLELGIQEFMRNGLYPLVWETPHYTASFKLYQTVTRYFSTAMEQRLSIEDFDFSQFFPYIIHRDLFGQRILPENLGYVPLRDTPEQSRPYVERIIQGAKSGLAVRDGFAACFFHAFLDNSLLEELVDGVRELGYTYIDVRELDNWVHARDRVILSGSQSYSVTLQDQYLLETTFDLNGEVISSRISDSRLKGEVKRSVTLEPGQWYRAEPVEFRDRKESFVSGLVHQAEQLYREVIGTDEQWKEARPAVIWNHYARGAAYLDQSAFAAALGSVNIAVDTLFIGERWDLSRYNLVVVPYGVVDSLSMPNFDDLTRFVAGGGHLITDGRNDLVENFGITLRETRLRVIQVRDRLFPQERIRWRHGELAVKFDAQEVDQVFCVDDATEAPLVIGKPWGKGKVLYFATRFDPHSGLGVSMYPYLLEYIRQYFQMGPVMRRENLEVFFDPGFRRQLSTEQLVRQWVRQGIRIIHVAGWHQYPKYTYDYPRLIRLAHANGILVYAWLEPPQVSQKFWLEHPEWRERNIRGEDVRPSWRYPVAMTDPACVQAMAAEYRRLLREYDWDGVNLAEVYFDAGRGFTDPLVFTPMHPSARTELRKRTGIDLAGLFDPASPFYWKSHPEAARAVIDYRVAALQRVYETLLPVMFEPGLVREGFEVIVTAMDGHGSPELREYYGVDMGQVLALQKRYGFTLNVEDPEHLWSTDPRRYVAIGRRYEELLRKRDHLMLDLNILAFRKPAAVSPFPTLIQTGTESFHLVNFAAMGAPRQVIYSEASVNPQDLLFFPYALAGGVQYRHDGESYRVRSPHSFMMKLPPEVRELEVDGTAVTPVRENLFLIPAGEHAVRLATAPARAFSAHELETRVLSFTGNILTLGYGLRSVSMTYESATRALLSLNREPTLVQVDGEGMAFEVLNGNDCFTVTLPPGRHRVEIIAGDVFSYGISFTSFWYTTAVAVFGTLAVVLLLVMYISVRIVRRRGGAPAEAA